MNKKLSLFSIIIIVIVIRALAVAGATALGSFTLPNSPPPNITFTTGTGIQDNSIDLCANGGGNNWDSTLNDTHMNASDRPSLIWNVSTDKNGDVIQTKLCIAMGPINTATLEVDSGDFSDICDIVNNWTNATAVNASYFNFTAEKVNYTYNRSINSTTFYVALRAIDNSTTTGFNRMWADIINYTFRLNNTPPLSPSLLNISKDTIRGVHNTRPDLNWTRGSDNEDGSGNNKCPADNTTYYLMIGDAAWGDTERVNARIFNLTNYTYGGTTLAWNTVVSEGGWVNKTYYTRLIANDMIANSSVYDSNFTLYDNLPTTPRNLNITQTHDPTPELAWLNSNESDGDTIQYLIIASTTANGNNDLMTLQNITLNSTQNWFSQAAILWSNDGQINGWANETVMLLINATDSGGSGLANGSYKANFTLYDFLPEVVNVSLSDVTGGYSLCTGSTCTLTPVGGTNISLAVMIGINDTDRDCDQTDANLVTTLYLCLNKSAYQNCSSSANPVSGFNYSWSLANITRLNDVCTAVFDYNLTAANGTPEFFRLAGDYLYHINATDQTGYNRLINDSERNGTWTYGTRQQPNFPGNITLGDDTIDLGTWNYGTRQYNLTNYGNVIFDLQWNATNPNAGIDTWQLNGTDFYLDDDGSLTDSPEYNLTSIVMNGTPLYYFNYSTGIQVCTNYLCDSPLINETLAAYWHIAPPVGLLAGTYNTTITYVDTAR